MYYDINQTMSHNCLLNFIVGARGYGKTYGWKKHIITNFKKTGEQAIWIRRYDNELQGFDETFLTDLKDIFPDDEFKYRSHKLYVNGKVAIYFQALSIAHKVKSSSFQNVTIMIYDEFLIETQGVAYLKDEPKRLLSFMDTVLRSRENFKGCYCLANSTSMFNPFFIYFKLLRKVNSKGIIKKDDILLQILESKDFSSFRKETRFGKLISQTDYGSYSMDNEFLFDKETFVEKINLKDCYYVATLIFEIKMGIWIHENGFYISDSYNDNNLNRFTTNKDFIDEKTKLISQTNNHYYKHIINDLKNGDLRFSSIKVKNIFLDNISY